MLSLREPVARDLGEHYWAGMTGTGAVVRVGHEIVRLSALREDGCVLFVEPAIHSVVFFAPQRDMSLLQSTN